MGKVSCLKSEKKLSKKRHKLIYLLGQVFKIYDQFDNEWTANPTFLPIKVYLNKKVKLMALIIL